MPYFLIILRMKMKLIYFNVTVSNQEWKSMPLTQKESVYDWPSNLCRSKPTSKPTLFPLRIRRVIPSYPKLFYSRLIHNYDLGENLKKDDAFVLLDIKVMWQPMNVSILMNAHWPMMKNIKLIIANFNFLSRYVTTPQSAPILLAV